jgi:circadian clock protein KaiB
MTPAGSWTDDIGNGPPPAGDDYVLRLFITGQTPRSTIAMENILRICEEHLHGRYKMDVVDIYLHPELAVAAQVVAAPTVVKLSPEPVRRIIGDMSDVDRVLTGLDLRPRRKEPAQ